MPDMNHGVQFSVYPVDFPDMGSYSLRVLYGGEFGSHTMQDVGQGSLTIHGKSTSLGRGHLVCVGGGVNHAPTRIIFLKLSLGYISVISRYILGTCSCRESLRFVRILSQFVLHEKNLVPPSTLIENYFT